VNGDSGNKDFNDIEHNQGILSSWEDSGPLDTNKKEINKALIFEAQESVIQCNEDIKENSWIANDFEEMDFNKSDNVENSSGFMKLNDSLIKNREIWKDKTERRDSYKKITNLDNKNSNSFLLKEDSKTNHKSWQEKFEFFFA